MKINPIIMLEGRQDGLDCEMRILQRCPEVYDYRVTKELGRLKSRDYNPSALWFIEGLDGDFPFLQNAENPAVVSAYFRAGAFHYSCMGERDSDPQYVGVRTKVEDIDRYAEALAKKGGEQIRVGRLVNQRQAISSVHSAQTVGLEQRVKEILALPKDQQEKIMRALLLGGQR
jgi:hypothetical protein